MSDDMLPAAPGNDGQRLPVPRGNDRLPAFRAHRDHVEVAAGVRHPLTLLRLAQVRDLVAKPRSPTGACWSSAAG